MLLSGKVKQLSLGKHRTKFSPLADMQLIQLFNRAVTSSGVDGVNWSEVGRLMNMTARQCRERYKYYLSPGIKNGPWTDEEDARLREKVGLLGCHWALMIRYFPGRTDVNLKNRWSCLRARKDTASKVAGSSPVQSFDMSVTVHQFIGKNDETEVGALFGAVFTKNDYADFLEENAFWDAELK